MTARQVHRAQPFRGWKTADGTPRTVTDIAADLAFEDTSWQADALCREMDPELFFDDAENPTSLDDARRACDLCPVQDECLEWRLSFFCSDEDQYGIFGGVGPKVRRDLRSERDVQEVAA